MNNQVDLISNHADLIKRTDHLPQDGLVPVLQGLYGEVGDLVTAVKKLSREPDSCTQFRKAAQEEFGDIFWYSLCLAIRLKIDIEIIFSRIFEQMPSLLKEAPNKDSIEGKPVFSTNANTVLMELGQLAVDFLNVDHIQKNKEKRLVKFFTTYFSAIETFGMDFRKVIEVNNRKISGRFIRPENGDLPTFDDSFPEHERIPENFAIEYFERTEHHQSMRMNGVFIGDPLTDAIRDEDGYRFHDVFHLAHAAILHWSPTFRALIKHKRKSEPQIDEQQDGGRAIVVEEGLVAWIFNAAKSENYFQAKENLTFDMLKTVHQFVSGFEAEKCPMILWEEAILKGYEVFREVKENKGGIVVGNRRARTLCYCKKRG